MAEHAKSISQPPVPPPSLTQTSNSQRRPPENKEIWSKRASLLSEYVQADGEYNKHLEATKSIRRLLKSQRAPPALETKLHEAELLLGNATEARKKVLERIIESNSWPKGSKIAAEEERKNMVSKIKAVHTLSQRLNDLLLEAQGPAVDLPASRPNKRSRTEDDEQASRDDVDRLGDRLTEMEQKLDDIQNTQDSLESDLKAEIYELCQDKVQELSMARSTKVDEKLSEFETLRAEVKEIADQVGEEMGRVDNNKTSIDNLYELDQKRNEEIVVLHKAFQEEKEAEERDVNEIIALTAALESYKKSPPSVLPLNKEYISRLVQHQVEAQVRESIRHQVENLRKDMQISVERQSSAIYTKLGEKLALTSETFSAVEALLQTRQ